MIRVKINLVNFLASTSSTSFIFYGVDTESIENTEKVFDRITFSYNSITQRHRVTLEYQGNSFNYDNNDILTNISDSYIVFSGNILRSTIIEFNNQFLSKDYIALNQDENITLCCYRQDDENNMINKSLSQIVDFIDGHFNSAIGLKNLDIDLVGFFARQFNYVYIQLFNRYYFVDSIEFISNDYTRLHLKEDVLMSHKYAIYEQNAFVTRNQSANNPDLVDTRLPLEDVLSVEYIVPTPTGSTNTKVNTTLDYEHAFADYHFIFSTISKSLIDSTIYPTYPPDSSGLPTMCWNRSRYTNIYYANASVVETLLKAIKGNDAQASFVNSVICVPFKVDSFIDASNQIIYVNDKELSNIGTFITGEEPPTILFERTGKCTKDSIPYFVISDFTFTITDNWLSRNPYAYYEIYIPFINWVKLDVNQIANKRLIIYYSMDYKTGLGTANIYDFTSQKLIFSANCEVGFKLDITTTNAMENARERLSLESNAVINTITGAIGLLGQQNAKQSSMRYFADRFNEIGKGIVQEKLQYEKANTTAGSGLNSLYQPNSVVIRKSYYKELSYTDSDVYADLQGKPYNAYVNLSDLEGNGYIEVGEIHFNPSSYDIYQDEVSEIVSLLKEGVII